MKLIIIDDDPIVSSSLKTILEKQDGIEVVAIGHDGTDAVTLYQQYQPDILLMDIRMKNMNGIDAGSLVLKSFPSARIVFLTTFQDDEYIQDALQIGAKGYLLKQDFENILLALKSVMAGQAVFGGSLVQKLSSSKQKPIKNSDLTDKELELLEHISNGHTNKEIASLLNYSEGTIRNQISMLLEKLALRDRTQLVIYYFNNLK